MVRDSPWPEASADLFRHVTADKAPLYRSIMDVFAAAKRQYRLHYHGDFDWAGIGIGNLVMRCWPASPWRFGGADYLEGVTTAALRPRDLCNGEEAVAAPVLMDLERRND